MKRYILGLGMLLSSLICLGDPVKEERVKAREVVKAAKERVEHKVVYNPKYFIIPYPNGDVPAEYGVCTDVVIRVYRKLGIDLQKRVHEDMKANFKLYPKVWGAQSTDTNIDHRRVYNLQTFFSRHGQVLKVTQKAADYLPGDLVTWELKVGKSFLPHIGIVIDEYSSDKKRRLIVHNVGAGPQKEDFLFDYKITGHYRYLPIKQKKNRKEGDKR